jgi:predicted SAM-dependent methyltransferase
MIEKISKKVISIDSDIESGSNYKTITEAIDKETYKYDGLFCEHVVEHIPVQELPQIFKELRVLLKKDADVVITVPNIYNFGNFFQNYEHINYSPPIHIAAIIEMEGYKCDNIFSWSKQKHFIRHTNFNETEVYIANFMEREYGLQLGRYVTIKMKTL